MAEMAKTKEAAKAVGLSTFYLYRNADRIPATFRAGRALRWDIELLRAWMRAQAANRK
jgi:predicted DNA-binding transcriptional regulator AlpA